MTIIPFEYAAEVGDRFLTLLKKYGITPPVGSSLEDELLSLTQLIEIAKNPEAASKKERLSVLRAAAGIHDLAAKVLSVEPIAEFHRFIPHLRLIGSNKIPTASLSQNSDSDIRDDTSRKIAELYLACLAAHVGHDVDLDNPNESRGNNPDVLFTLERSDNQSRNRWALAIKTISTQNGQTIFERIKEGGKQINRSDADFGLIVINTKNVIDHNAFWNAQFDQLQTATDALRTQMINLINNAISNREKSEWDAVFQGNVVRPVIFMAQTLLGGDEQVSVPLKLLTLYDAEGTSDTAGWELAANLHDFMQRVQRGIPGADGEFPS